MERIIVCYYKSLGTVRSASEAMPNAFPQIKISLSADDKFAILESLIERKSIRKSNVRVSIIFSDVL
jgi:hypothetical protein